MKNKIALENVQEFLPKESKARDTLLKKVEKIAIKNDYRKIQTPSIDYHDSLAPGLADTQKDRAIKFFDTEGKMLVLRPDNTTPIAKLVASHMKHIKDPIRLYYQTQKFQQRHERRNDNMEIFESGFERFGDGNEKADAEIITLLADSLTALGFKDFGIEIGHVDFAKGLSQKKQDALLKTDYIQFGSLPERGDAKLLNDHPSLKALSKHLKSDVKAHISVNKGLIKGLSYYTGIIFEATVPGIGKPIASGGRYDDLSKKFGYACPAVGVALDMDAIEEAKNKK